MSTLIKMFTVLIGLNIFMYLGVNFASSINGANTLNNDLNFHFNGDLIDSFMNGQTTLNNITASTRENWTDYNIKFDSNFTTIPSQESGEVTGTGGIAFLDPLKMIYSFIKTLANLAIAPLTLFFNFNMPVFVGLMIGIPYFIILVLCIFAFIKGVGD